MLQKMPRSSSSAVGANEKAPRHKAFHLTAPTIREHSRHRQIADVLRLELAPAGKISRDGVVWYSTDHADFAGNVPGIRMTRGIIAGLPDTILLYQGHAYYMEIKIENGVMSDPQRAVATALLAANCNYAVVRNAADVLRCLDAWAIPRARRTAL